MTDKEKNLRSSYTAVQAFGILCWGLGSVFVNVSLLLVILVASMSLGNAGISPHGLTFSGTQALFVSPGIFVGRFLMWYGKRLEHGPLRREP